jgi:hypothetical protein
MRPVTLATDVPIRMVIRSHFAHEMETGTAIVGV